MNNNIPVFIYLDYARYLYKDLLAISSVYKLALCFLLILPEKDEAIIEHFMSMPSSSRKICKILEWILVLPATNATSERTFSKLKLVKTTIYCDSREA